MRDPNLTGGLPFPDMTGRRRPPRPLKPSARALTPKQALTESAHQQQLFTWLKLWSRFVPILARTYHVANEHNGTVVTRAKRDGTVVRYCPSGARRKAEGVRPGVFDLANHGMSELREVIRTRTSTISGARLFSGLFIDLKVRHGELSNEPKAEWDQVRELKWLRSQQKSAHVVWCWAEAAALHAWYFDVRRVDVWCSIDRFAPYLVHGGHDELCGCGVNLLAEVAKYVR